MDILINVALVAGLVALVFLKLTKGSESAPKKSDMDPTRIPFADEDEWTDPSWSMLPYNIHNDTIFKDD